MRPALLAGAVLLAALAAWASTTEQVELSAPILPRVEVLYAKEGPRFPATAAEREALAHEAALQFSALLTSCAASFPTITLQTPGGPALSAQALAANYEAVARCAYEQHTSKPYWIPRLVDLVDVCGNELGAGWRLPTEADVDAFTTAELQALSDALTPAGGPAFGALYFSMRVYVRGADGTLKQADLTPGLQGARVSPLTLTGGACPAGGDCATYHLESGLALRCVRTSPVAAP